MPGDAKRPILEEYIDHMTIELRDNPLFREAWREWLLDRKDRRKPVTTRAAALQLRKLNDMSDPVASIHQSIENGWQGVFPVTGKDGRVSREDKSSLPVIKARGR
jgi:hypothetical protein